MDYHNMVSKSRCDLKIKIPRLSIDPRDDLYEKNIKVTAWKNKLISYAQVYQLYDIMFKPDEPLIFNGPKNDEEFEDYYQNSDLTDDELKEKYSSYCQKWKDYNKNVQAKEELQAKAKAVLMTALDDNLNCTFVDGKQDCYEIIQSLLSSLLRGDNVARAMLLNDFAVFSMVNKDFDTYCEELNFICNRLAGFGIVKTEMEKVSKVMTNLLDAKYYIWNQVQLQIKLDGSMTFDEAINIIKSYILLMDNKKSQSSSYNKKKILNSAIIGGKKSDVKPYNKKKFNSKPSFNMSNVKCYNCGKMGHYAKNCKSKSAIKKYDHDRKSKKVMEVKKKELSSDSSDSDSNSSDDKGKSVTITKKKSSNKGKVKVSTITVVRGGRIPINASRPVTSTFKEGENPVMILDSGAQSTVFSKVHPVMDNLISNRNIDLVFAGGESVKVEATGDIGEVSGIHCSSSLTNECISVSQLAKLGYVVIFDHDAAYILKRGVDVDVRKSNILLTAKASNGLYNIHMNDFIQTFINESL